MGYCAKPRRFIYELNGVAIVVKGTASNPFLPCAGSPPAELFRRAAHERLTQEVYRDG